jgi:hypothetical protein
MASLRLSCGLPHLFVVFFGCEHAWFPGRTLFVGTILCSHLVSVQLLPFTGSARRVSFFMRHFMSLSMRHSMRLAWPLLAPTNHIAVRLMRACQPVWLPELQLS